MLAQVTAWHPFLHQCRDCRVEDCRARRGRDFSDVLYIIGEAFLAIDGIVQKDGIAMAGIKLALDDTGLCVDAFIGKAFEIGRLVEAAQNGESMLSEKRVQGVQLIGMKDADIGIDAACLHGRNPEIAALFIRPFKRIPKRMHWYSDRPERPSSGMPDSFPR